jgi:hypothetical protein
VFCYVFQHDSLCHTFLWLELGGDVVIINLDGKYRYQWMCNTFISFNTHDGQLRSGDVKKIKYKARPVSLWHWNKATVTSGTKPSWRRNTNMMTVIYSLDICVLVIPVLLMPIACLVSKLQETVPWFQLSYKGICIQSTFVTKRNLSIF